MNVACPCCGEEFEAAPEAQLTIHEVLSKGHGHFVVQQLATGINPAMIDEEGRSLLHQAAGEGSAEVVTALLEWPFSELTEDYHFTALQEAARNGHSEVAEVLVEKGVEESLPPSNGNTSLGIAAQSGHPKVVEVLLRAGANPLEEAGRTTPLELAFGFGFGAGPEETVRRLVQAASVRLGSEETSWTSLHEMALRSDLEAVRRELRLENDPNAEAGPHLGEYRKSTPLHWAVVGNQPRIARELIQEGSDPNASAGRFDETPLHLAAVHGCSKLVETLVDEKADLKARNGYHETPLHLSALHGTPSVARILLQSGANPHVTDEDGVTPVERAVLSNSPEVLRKLLKVGRDLGTEDLRRIGWGSHRDISQLVQVFVDQGVRVDITNKEELTPLQQAVKAGDFGAARVLLGAGADPARTDEQGRTPAEQLAASGDPAVRAAIAEHSDTPEYVLDLMMRAGSRPDLSGLSDGEPGSLSAEERSRLRKAGPYGKRLVAAHPGTPPAEVTELAKAVPGAVIQNEAAEVFDFEDPGWKRELSTEGWWALLAEPEVPKGWLREGAGHEQVSVRIKVAHHPNTPPDVLEALTEDPNATIQEVSQRRLQKQRREVARCLSAICNPAARLQRVLGVLQAETPCLECDEDMPVAQRSGTAESLQCPVCGAEQGQDQALLVAARRGEVEAVAALLQMEADPGATDEKARPVLHLAAEGGHPEVVKTLLGAGANPEGTDGCRTALHRAAESWHPLAESGHPEVAELLLNAGASVDMTDILSRTPLHRAVKEGRAEVAEVLLEAGADPEITDKEGRTPLQRAIVDDPEMMKVLVNGGADVLVADDDGRSPLHEVDKCGYPELVDLLSRNDARLDATDDKGHTSLHLAAFNDDLEMVELLLEKGACPDVTDRFGHTPLHAAACEGHPEVAEVLLEKDARPVATENNGSTPLHMAAYCGNFEMAKWLLEKCIHLDATTNDGETPLHRAAAHPTEEGQAEVAEVLLEEGARHDLTNGDGQTPLHKAARIGNLEVAKVLLKNGADVEATDEEGLAPLDVAVENDSADVAGLLVEADADFSDLSTEGLEILVGHERSSVRKAVATFSRALSNVINLMGRAGSKSDLSGLSEEKPGPITETERERLVEMGPYGKTLVAAHPDTPREELFELAEEVPEGFLQNPVLDALRLEDPGWRQKMPATALASVLRVSDVPSRWLEEGARHEDPEVRMAVAENESTSPEVLRELAGDFFQEVCDAATKNPAFPTDAPDG